jgi:phosphate transport system permease protein
MGVSVLTTLGLVVVLVSGAWQFFYRLWELPEHSPWDFFTDTRWTPGFRDQHFGIHPLLCGTMLVTVGSLLIAIPLGLASAVYLAEYASPRFRELSRPALDILAGIPSIVFGYVAIMFVSPVIRWVHPAADVFNAASASVVVAIMVLPMIVSLSEEVIRSVPSQLRDAAYALGATKFDVTFGVTLPAAASGILASFLLAFSRAVGETMAVSMAAGLQPNLTWDVFSSVETMTAAILKTCAGQTSADSLEYKSVFALGLALFVCTFMVNILAQYALKRVRRYG